VLGFLIVVLLLFLPHGMISIGERFRRAPRAPGAAAPAPAAAPSALSGGAAREAGHG